MAGSVRHWASTDVVCLLLLAGSWGLAILVVNPVGEFPLNDDWAYAHSVQVLMEEGDFRLSGWTATNLMAQVFWGALFCLPFGFSFTALRLSTLALGLAGVLATYGLLREVRAPASVAVLGALVLAFNPIYFGLSFTFMNDVPFAAIATISSYLVLRGLRRNSRSRMGLGLLLAGAAVLTRQTGLALLPAFACAWLVKRGIRMRTLLVAATLVGAAVAVQAAYQGWLLWSERLPLKFGNQIRTIRGQLRQDLILVLADALTVALYALVYWGLFLAAFLLVVTLRGPAPAAQSRWLGSGAGVVAVLIAAVLVSQGWLMPLYGNILTAAGIGPVIINGSTTFAAPPGFWLAATVIGIGGAAVLLVHLVVAGMQVLKPSLASARSDDGWVKVYAFAAIGISFAPLALLGFGPFGFYDRYLIVFLPWLMLLVSASIPGLPGFRMRGVRAAFGWGLLLVMAGFAIGGTHDYLAWNRARWAALHELMHDRQITPDRIDGGFEFNAWHLYDDEHSYDEAKSWYWVDRDDFVVSFRTLGGHDVIARRPVAWWLPWAEGDLVVQQKASRPSP